MLLEFNQVQWEEGIQKGGQSSWAVLCGTQGVGSWGRISNENQVDYLTNLFVRGTQAEREGPGGKQR